VAGVIEPDMAVLRVIAQHDATDRMIQFEHERHERLARYAAAWQTKWDQAKAKPHRVYALPRSAA